ncbi:heterokaryon incompatibility protein-domain-containing protein [Xylaria arbuscula]|nr:heterokaryon incompatibility protein-domain-containing protein [Xylaria arbuscula]
MGSDTPYKYSAIKAPRTIRVMHLHPGAETDPVLFSLVTTSLDPAPDFEAVSYCWGTAQDKRQVTCNDASVYITNSLFTGLLHFRHADRPRILWADAVCINQADLAEKSAQVLLMPLIYSQATRTLIWLGVADDPVFGSISPGVTESIHQALRLLPEISPENPGDTAATLQAVHRESQRLRDEGKPNLLDHDWALLVALLERPWFRRKWVVQEVALAKQALLYVGGGVEIAWSDLARLAFNMEEMGLQRLLNLETGKTVLESITIPLHCVTNVFMVQVFRQRATLLDGVITTMDFHCTDPRDHVYSLLSLGALGPTIVPDYDVAVDEVFHRFAIAMMVEEGESLKMLSLALDRSGFFSPGMQNLENLPSWVPDLRLMRSEALVSYTVRPQAFFAGGRAKPILNLSDDQRILRCKGRIIDTVYKYSTSLVEMLLADMPELRGSSRSLVDPQRERRGKRLVRWLEECYQLAFSGDDSHEIANPAEEAMGAFSRTMTCDMDPMRNRLPAELTARFPQYMQWAKDRVSNWQDKEGQHLASTPNYSAVIEDSIIALTAWLKFCVTHGGRFGQIPPDSQPGDRICVLVGGEVPFVIRLTGRGTYTLVGECYLDGVMDGETFVGGRIEPQLLEDIHLE